ncbi:MAG: prealbumin-like fold domain-containing protein [Oscillospiraceae bacterium]|nr:prealbumin-like fold domain-containing protein [Oscillospiraceae bacterium]
MSKSENSKKISRITLIIAIIIIVLFSTIALATIILSNENNALENETNAKTPSNEKLYISLSVQGVRPVQEREEGLFEIITSDNAIFEVARVTDGIIHETVKYDTGKTGRIRIDTGFITVGEEIIYRIEEAKTPAGYERMEEPLYIKTIVNRLQNEGNGWISSLGAHIEVGEMINGRFVAADKDHEFERWRLSLYLHGNTIILDLLKREACPKEICGGALCVDCNECLDCGNCFCGDDSFDLIIRKTDELGEKITTQRATFEVTRIGEVQIGDFVEFTPNSASYTVPATLSGTVNYWGVQEQTFETEELQWRIMCLENNRVTLISSEPTSDWLMLFGALRI